MTRPQSDIAHIAAIPWFAGANPVW